MSTVLTLLLTVVVLYFFVINTIYLIILIISIIIINRNRKSRFTFNIEQAFKFRLLPPVSIILPAFNEAKTIVESIRSILFVRYPEYELIIVNDGSSDNTLNVLIESFGLLKTDYVFRRVINTENIRGIYSSREHDNLVVIDKKNGGKADALNAGINVSRYPYFCAVDADTILGEDSLAKLIQPFVKDPEKTVAVGGVVKAANGSNVRMGRLLNERIPGNILVIMQSIEYARAFFMGRLGLSALNSLLIISGAFGLFKKSDVLEVKGYMKKSLGEDMMLVVKLHKLKRIEKQKYRVSFVPDTVCWTELPSSMKVLRKQRVRWQMGLIESIMGNRDMLFNRKYGIIGLFSFPFHLFTEIVSPFIEVAAYIAIITGAILNTISLDYVFYFLTVTWVFSIGHSFIGLVMEQYGIGKALRFHHFLIKMFTSLLENVFYRQLNLFYRILGTFKYFTKKREWGEMDRKGFGINKPDKIKTN
jgi:cellulose synthase/poly-beta-1,6-N-acetylglucosamine synthase-like glycosyltransferase